MSWFSDSSGNNFTTADGKPPSGYGTTVTIANGSGQPANGWWNGTTAVPNS